MLYIRPAYYGIGTEPWCGTFHHEPCEEKEWEQAESAGGSSAATRFGFMFRFQTQTSAWRSLRSERRTCSPLLLGRNEQKTSTQQAHHFIPETTLNKESHNKHPGERVGGVWMFSEGTFTHALENQISHVWKVGTRREVNVWRDNRIPHQKLSDLFACLLVTFKML